MKHFLLTTFLLTIFLSLHAQSARNMDEEKVYIDELTAIDSTAVPVFMEATRAMDSLNFDVAIQRFDSVLVSAPEFTPALRRLGFCYSKVGALDTAVSLCVRSYALDNTWESAMMLVNVYFEYTQETSDGIMYHQRALELIEDNRHKPGAPDYIFGMMLADYAAKHDRIELFDKEVRYLIQAYPDSMGPHYWATNLFAYYGEWEKANEELNKAEELGLDAEAVEEIRNAGLDEEITFIRRKQLLKWTFLGWIIGLAALFLVGLILSAITLRKVERQIAGGGPLQTNGFRKAYRMIVNTAGIYYYLSLPLVLILLLVIVIGSIYLFFSIGRIPVYFFFLIIASGGITIFFMIKTLVIKPKTEEAGRVLKEEEAPELFALSREVAADMKTRPVEEIRLTPHVDMAVYERGKWREKVQDKATRVLLIGAGILNEFKVDEFRAVLAHEYGHFSNRDTAGGSVAFRVRNDIHRYAFSLAINGQARWWNLAYQFLRLYDFIFRRISHGATRLQEILADRAAAELYGAMAFEKGLTHVIVKDIEFNTIAGNEIKEAKNNRRSFNNLYELPKGYVNQIESQVKEYMSKKTTNDDTHPCPADRFRYVSGISGMKKHQSSRNVTELFRDWSAITAEQTRVVEEEWKAHPAPGM